MNYPCTDITIFKPCSNGVGERHWYIHRADKPPHQAIVKDSRGRYRRFASYENALRAAAVLVEPVS